METLIFRAPDKEKAKALLQVAKVLGISVVTSAKKAKPKAEKAYNQEFVSKVEKGRQQIREGKTFAVELKDLWK